VDDFADRELDQIGRPVGIIVSALVSIVAGVVLGTIPFVNHYLHWNMWVIIPISGLILGAGFGWLQFQIAKVLSSPIGVGAGIFLTLVGGLSYLATDAGIWLTTSVEVDKGQTVALRDAVSFGEYEAMRFQHSSISTRGRKVEMGTTGTIITFVVDELGAMAGAAALLFGLASSASYCRRCSRYRKTHLTIERAFPLEGPEADGLWQALTQLAAGPNYPQIAAQLQGLPQLNIATRRKVEVAEAVCPKCGQGELQVNVMRHEKDSWTTEGLSIKSESGPNEAPRLSG
jgi:hypothetical protein